MVNTVQLGKRDGGVMVIRMLLGLIVPCLWASSVLAGLSSSSYVQEGLILQLDGVENVTRGGAHVAESAVWNDLVSGGAVYFPVSGDGAFANADALAVTNTWQTAAEGADKSRVHTAVLKAVYSAEVAYNEMLPTVLDPSWKSKRPAGELLQFGHPGYWMGIDWNISTGTTDCWVGFNPRGSGREPGINVLANLGSDKIRGAHTLGVRQNANDCNIFFDGRNIATNTVDATAEDNEINKTWFFDLIINGATSYPNGGINGKYHSVRFYDRALSDDEHYLNRTIDAIRFFGGDPASFTLPSGWRFADIATDVKLEHHFATVSASVAAGGTVQVGAAAAASSVDVWNEYPALPVRTLSAVPTAGYRFMRWRGIESTDPYQATQTDVVVTGEVVAVFYATGPHTLNSKSYVQDGLQFQFDAVENVTRGGAHVADSAVWNDLVSGGALNFGVSETGASFVNGNALSVARAWGTVAVGARSDEIRAMYYSANFTVEVAYDQAESNPDSGDGSYKGYFRKMLEFGHPGYWVGIDWSTETQKDYAIGFSPYLHRREHHINTGIYGAHQMTLGRHVVSCVQIDSDTTNVRFDHVNSQDGRFADPVEHQNWSGLRLNSGYFPNSGMDGLYHELRFYNRVLTDDERRVNYEVDAVRFFGKDPADSALPAGYRFGTAEGVCLERQRTIASSDASLGLVRVGSGAEAASVDAWIDVAAPQVALTAVPADGCKFVRWRGAVSGADLKAATGVFAVTGDVTAEFREITGLMVIVK